jgi:putative tryptophan/tyrosine transport system substrate-binding protein
MVRALSESSANALDWLPARVLRGARPSEIPVERPTTFELVVNVKAAKAIGHEIPAGFVLRADKLVE